MKQIALGVLTALLAACASGGGPRPEPPPELAALAIVVSDQHGAVVEGAALDTSVIPGAPDAVTNADGYASVVVPQHVTFVIQVTKDGYGVHYDDQVRLAGNRQEPITLPRDGPPPHPAPLQGRLRIEGGCFRDDTGCVNPIYAHGGDLYSVYVRDTARTLRELDDVAAAGYHGLRVWSTLGCEGGPCTEFDDRGRPNYWYRREVGPGVTPDYWSRIDSFFADIRSRGLRLVWSQGDVRALGDRRHAMGEFARREHGVIDFIDCGNEAYSTGEPDPRKLAQCIGYYAEAGGRGLKSTTDVPLYTGGRWTDWVLPPSDVFDIHSFRRDHFWAKIRHAFNYGYENTPPLPFGISSEPPGNGWRVSVTDNKHELDDEAVALLALASLLGRQAHVWFSGQGVILEGGLNQEAGFYSTPRAVALLPRDVMTYGLIHHSGERWRNERVLETQGEVRIDGRQAADGRIAYIIYGPSGSYRLRVARSFDGLLCHPGTGQCDGVSKNAGETLDVSFTRGRLLVGRTR